MQDIRSGRGDSMNPVMIGQENVLLGDPSIKTEKPHTVLIFPGGHVEIARTDEDEYWVHVAVRETGPNQPSGRIVAARLDADGRYSDEINSALTDEVARGDVNHIAFRIAPPARVAG